MKLKFASIFKETISTCKFAQRVALVNTEAIINEEEDPNLEITNLKMEIEKLKKELAFYKEQNPLQNSVSITNYSLIIIYCTIVIFFAYS